MPKRSYRISLSWREDPEDSPAPLTIEARTYAEAHQKAEKAVDTGITHPDGDSAQVSPFGHQVMINGSWITVAMAKGQECVNARGTAVWESARVGTFEETFADFQGNVWVPVGEFERAATAYGWPDKEPLGPPDPWST